MIRTATIAANLFPGGDFLLSRHCALPRSLAGPGVGVRPLPSHGKVAPVAQPAVALNFDQPADVHLNLLAEIPFHAPLGFDRLAQPVNFFLGQVLNLLCVFHVRLDAKRASAGLSNSIDRRQTDPDALLRRKINSSNTCHACSLTLLRSIPGAACVSD